MYRVFEGVQVIIISQKALYLSEHGFKPLKRLTGLKSLKGIVFYIIDPNKSEGLQC